MVDFDGKHIVIPSWDGVSRQVAEAWRLPKDAHLVVCSVWTHPEGAELRLTVDGKLQQAEATTTSSCSPRWRWRGRSDGTGSRDGASAQPLH